MATANKTFNTRVQHKNDIEANWIQAVNFKPLLGEIIIYNAETEGNVNHLPKDPVTKEQIRNYYITYTRFKIGDGNTTVTDLPFIKCGVMVSEDGEGNVSIF